MTFRDSRCVHIGVAALVFISLASATAAAQKESESAYDRMIRTRVLRCAYLPYEPYISKDPNTGALSGITVDYINNATKKLGIKTVWAGEVNIDQVVPSLEGGKFDAFCLPCIPDKNWSKVLDFKGNAGSILYYTYVPEKSDMNEETLKSARFAIQDGFAMSDITKRSFPSAKTYSMPQSASQAEMYDQLKYKKADAIVNESISANAYIKNNPGTIRRFSDTPVSTEKTYFVVRKGDEKMGEFFENILSASSPENSEALRELLKKYNAQDSIITK